MKTAISIPDAIFARVERLAREHGMHRSQFFAVAAERYAEQLESAGLTHAINAAVDAANADESTTFAGAAGRHRLLAVEDEW